MKAAILGTTPSEAQQLLQDVGIRALRRMAGYQPQTMPFEIPKLPSISKPNQSTADKVMAILCGSGAGVRNCNPRVPYLMLAWLLVGADNEYRVSDYAAPYSFLQPVLALLLRCAMGERFTAEVFDTYIFTSFASNIGHSREDWAYYADETISWIVEAMKELNGTGHRATESVRAVLWSATRFSVLHASLVIQQQARAWCYLDDEEAWLVIQSLLLDALTDTL